MRKNRGSYDAVQVEIIQPIQDRPDDRLVRIRMEEYIDGLLPEPDRTHGRSVSEIARDNSWADEEEPELPAPPRPDWA